MTSANERIESMASSVSMCVLQPSVSDEPPSVTVI